MGEYSGNHPRFSRKEEMIHDRELIYDTKKQLHRADEAYKHPGKQTENYMNTADERDMSGAYNAMGDANHPPRQGMWDTIKKVGRTIKQGAKDIGYQAFDMITSDPGGVGGTGARRDKDLARTNKFYEQRNYDISRAKAASGETYGSLGDYFDDSGYGNFLGIGADSKRGAKGSAQPNTLQNKLSDEEKRDIRLSNIK